MAKNSYRPLLIPKRFRETRQGYGVRCNKCNRNVTDKCGLSKKRIHTCKSPDSHRFVSKVYDPVKGIMIHGKSWPKELRVNEEYYRLHDEFVKNHSKPRIAKIDGKPLLLTSCLAYYADYIADKGVPSHKKRLNSEKYIQSQVFNLRVLKNALNDAGINPDFLPITDFDDNHVGIVHDYLLNKYVNKTYNHKMATYKALFRFLLSKDYQVKNVFEEVVQRNTKAKTETIAIAEFNALCESVNPLGGQALEEQMRNGKRRKFRRNLYRPYLIDVWKFALYSGCRKSEIQSVRVKDIGEEHIACIDQKASAKKKEQVVRMIWLNEELLSLVGKLRKGLSPEDYLLAPQELNRSNMMHVVSRAFSHYWSKVSDRELRFHDLRNTYATAIIKSFGPKMSEILGGLHSDSAVTIEHYLNKEEIMKENVGKRLFE